MQVKHHEPESCWLTRGSVLHKAGLWVDKLSGKWGGTQLRVTQWFGDKARVGLPVGDMEPLADVGACALISGGPQVPGPVLAPLSPPPLVGSSPAHCLVPHCRRGLQFAV
jgi:hypothetical protein